MIRRTYYGKIIKDEFVPNERYLKLTKKKKILAFCVILFDICGGIYRP